MPKICDDEFRSFDMRSTNRTDSAMVLIAAVFAFLSLFFAVSIQFSDDAAAQSSVRPPANATRRVEPCSSPKFGFAVRDVLPLTLN